MKKTKKQKLKDEADRVFSIYIRLKKADWKEFCTCYTCGKVAHYKDGMQCGHFISRSSNILRYDERNARVQCYVCNVIKHGNYIEYTLRLIKEKGVRFVNWLKKKGKEEHQFTEKELEKIINKFNKKIEKLKETN